uniref:PHD-type domain-containing protein n=1 Tax=Cacopsylla melanoneura TaxID=428564 RepID=A0A8D9AL45_9HEMI
MSCSKCKKGFSSEELKIACSSCNSQLHYVCAEVSAPTMRKLGKDVSTWKCKECQSKAVNNTGLDAKFDKFTDTMTELFSTFKREITEKLTDFEKSVQYHSSQMEEVLSGFNEMKRNFVQLQAKQEELVKENDTLKKTVKELQSHVVDMDQKSLDHVLEISGIPDRITEPVEIMGSLCKKINMNTPEINAYTVKRIPSTGQGRSKMTIVTFESKFVRDEILKASKKYKPKVLDFTNASNDIQSVFVNEQLTPHNKKLFFNATKVKRDKGFSFLWVSEGKILLKKTQDARIKRIFNIEDME